MMKKTVTYIRKFNASGLAGLAIAALIVLPSISSVAADEDVGGGSPMITDDTGTPGNQQWEINLAVTADWLKGQGAMFEKPLVDINYGVGERVELKYEMPWLVAHDSDGKETSSLGNALVGIKYRFLDDKKSGISMSIYPQVGLNTSRHSVHVGLVNNGVEYIMPVEVTKTFVKGLTVGTEVGYDHTDAEGSGIFSGLFVGKSINKAVEILAEIHGNYAMDTREHTILVNLGSRVHLSEHFTLLLSVGKRVTAWSSDKTGETIAYIGIQYTGGKKSTKPPASEDD